MSDNIDILKVRSLTQADQLVNVENAHSLKNVLEEIEDTKKSVNHYKSDVDSLQPPVVEGEPWYKFPFGKASVEEVNKTMKSFSDFVQKTFKLVAEAQNSQNKNIQNICQLIGLLAIAEAKSYEKIEDLSLNIEELSTEDEETTKQLKELGESFLKSIDDSKDDDEAKAEQMSQLIEYIKLFAESKTKKIRSISISLAKIRTKLEGFCSTQDKWIEDADKKINSWQEEVAGTLEERNRQLEITLRNIVNEKNIQLENSFVSEKNKLEESVTIQNNIINKNLELQNAKIQESSKVIWDRIIEYRSIIEKQETIIESQNASIKNLNRTILSLYKKVNLALITVIVEFVVMIGVVLYVFM